MRSWRQRLRDESELYPWSAALIRMAADAVSVNGSMLAAFIVWYFVQAVVLKAAPPENIARSFKNFVQGYWILWTGLALLVFQLHGFYSRTRAYARRYKAWVLFRTVSLFMVIFVFTDYFLFRGALVPRGVLIIAWTLCLVLVGASRLVKHQFLKTYKVQPLRKPEKTDRVLVVGGAGYLGSCLARQLLARGYRVRVLDKFLFGEDGIAALLQDPRFEMIRGDVRDIQAVVEATKDCGAVIHLAAIVGDPACEENRDLAVETNRVATRMLIDVAKGYGVSRFVFASTCSVYGASDRLMDEYGELAPISTYAQTKVDSEQLLLDAGGPDFHPTILRLGTLFGMSDRPRFDLVVNLLTARAVRTGKITIFNGEQWRPFLHVRDAARAFVLAMEADPSIVSCQIFNVGDSDLNLTLNQLSKTISDAIANLEVETVENGDRRNYRASFDKIRSQLGFRCNESMGNGILEIRDALLADRSIDFNDTAFNNRAAVRAFAQSAAAGEHSLRIWAELARGDVALKTASRQ